MKKMNIMLIHHSHTDIGYTNRQEKIEFHHIQYIKRIVDILNKAYKENNQYKEFKWVCESYWCVEKFLAKVSKQYKDDFVKYVNLGNITVSANYLNCTDILDETILKDTAEICKKQADELGFKMKSAMTADINGYSWGYPQALIDIGVENLISCVHTHHGYHATNKKQRPFYWQTPKGDKILVWHGDHYHLGCEFAINGSGSQFEYMIKDGLSKEGVSDAEYAKQRLFRYVENLADENYPYDFIPITISGLSTDNSPPSEMIVDYINDWNEKYGDEIHLQMAGLDEFFKKVRDSDVEIETFSGDWTDWWADGTISTPNVIKHYREAVAKYNILKTLDPKMEFINKELMETARYNLMFYSEHTWGFSASMSEPCHKLVNDLDMRKQMYAGIANEAVCRCLDEYCEHFGETAYVLGKDYSFTVINPNDIAVKKNVALDLEILFTHSNFNIIDETTNKPVPYQHDTVARGHQLNFVVELKPLEMKKFHLEELPKPVLNTTGMYADGGCDGINDLNQWYERKASIIATPFGVETPFIKMKFDVPNGITSIVDKGNGKSILREDREFNPFTPIYEVTPKELDPCLDRRNMGRNRKCLRTQRHVGELNNVEILSCGEIYAKIKLSYNLKGTDLCEIIITAFAHTPRIDIAFCLNKQSVWEPENVYLALPFTASENQTVYVDKLGAILRPRIDQVKATCSDFYELQNGVAFVGEKSSVLVALTDAPMISMGTIKMHPIKLSGDEGLVNNDLVYSWVMNNFWETNFKASLAGFQEYRYSLILSDKTDKTDCIKEIKATNYGTVEFYSFDR